MSNDWGLRLENIGMLDVNPFKLLTRLNACGTAKLRLC